MILNIYFKTVGNKLAKNDIEKYTEKKEQNIFKLRLQVGNISNVIKSNELK